MFAMIRFTRDGVEDRILGVMGFEAGEGAHYAQQLCERMGPGWSWHWETTEEQAQRIALQEQYRLDRMDYAI